VTPAPPLSGQAAAQTESLHISRTIDSGGLIRPKNEPTTSHNLCLGTSAAGFRSIEASSHTQEPRVSYSQFVLEQEMTDR
jgi:hypothetical protein